MGDESGQRPPWSLVEGQYASLIPLAGSPTKVAGVKRPFADIIDFETVRPSKRPSYCQTVPSQESHVNGSGIVPGNIPRVFIGLKNESATRSGQSGETVATASMLANTYPTGKPVMEGSVGEVSIDEKPHIHKQDPLRSLDSESSGGTATPSCQDRPQEIILNDRKDISEALRLLREEGYNVQKKNFKINAGSAASNKSELRLSCQVCHGFTGRPCEIKYVSTPLELVYV